VGCGHTNCCSQQLADFGTCVKLDEDGKVMIKSSLAVGTLDYMSPEVGPALAGGEPEQTHAEPEKDRPRHRSMLLKPRAQGTLFASSSKLSRNDTKCNFILD